MKRKKLLFFVNLLLLVIIVIFAYFKVYKKTVNFNCEYGTIPVEILKISRTAFPGNKLGHNGSALKIICIFNKLPNVVELENIEKLFNLYKAKMSAEVIFTKKFKKTFTLNFPHRFLTRYKFFCKSHRISNEDNFYMVLLGERIVYSEKNFDFIDMNFTIQSNLSGKSLLDCQISAKELKRTILKRLKGKDLELLDIITDDLRKFEIFSDFAEIYFFHANCSTCKLKEMLKNLKLKTIIDDEKIMIIFSIFANRFELKSLLQETNFQFPVYIDYRDEFRLHSRLTDERANPVVIKVEELGIDVEKE